LGQKSKKQAFSLRKKGGQEDGKERIKPEAGTKKGITRGKKADGVTMGDSKKEDPGQERHQKDGHEQKKKKGRVLGGQPHCL